MRHRTAVGIASSALLAVCLAAGTARPHGQAAPRAAWVPDTGDGSYRNPVLFADYSDPDVERVGDDFYLVSSSFHVAPGLPILRSRDLVNWTILGHAADRLPSPLFDRPQNGKGLWAPSLRHHDGRFWIFVGDPDRGILVTTARDPQGPWEPLTLVKPALGAIDPCPLWDDDGALYLVHAWAKSRAGFNGILTLNRLSPDGRRVVGDGVTIFDGGERHPTIEGPKLHKRGGYYYVFAPAGGVATGWQTVLRSRSVHGPYEDRIVLAQGSTAVNGPHQGALVETPGGESWFLHFQDRGSYGRVVHLQPVRWRDGWPVIGVDADEDGRGEPVAAWRKPDVGAPHQPLVPQTGDEFDGTRLGLQWQWNANPEPGWWSLTRPGFLRLHPVEQKGGASNLWETGGLLLQKLPAEAFTATTAVDAGRLGLGESAGLLVMGRDHASLTVGRTPGGWRVRKAVCAKADVGGAEREEASASVPSGSLRLRVTVEKGAAARFSYSVDGARYVELGAPFATRPGAWIGARVGLFARAAADKGAAGHADFDWFRIEP